MLKKIRKNFKKVNSQKGFTLLEILVVLTIMGFLIAMVAPRLAGISGDAVDIVCDTNQNRMITYMSTYYEDTNRYPNHLTNLVITDGAALNNAAYQIPTASNMDPADEQEVLSNELYVRNHFYIHHLNDDEVDELKNMGVAAVFNLNDYTGIPNPNLPNDVIPVAPVVAARASMEEVGLSGYDITSGDVLAVAMVGCGIDAGGNWDSAAEERGWGEPGNFARILLGMGSECGLITSGVISNAAHCPGGIQNDDNVIYNDYILLLPRLAATTARMPAMPAAIDNIANPEGIDCAAYDEGANLGAAGAYALAGNAELLKIRAFNITEPQGMWMFATMCPEGHMYPADDEEFWAVDIDDDGSI